MDKDKTGFINVENKPLPFKGNFKYHGKPTAQGGVFAALKAYSDNPEINCIVIDSLSAVLDMFLAEAKSTKKGFDVYNYYLSNLMLKLFHQDEQEHHSTTQWNYHRFFSFQKFLL